jgi:hypothetical protein
MADSRDLVQFELLLPFTHVQFSQKIVSICQEEDKQHERSIYFVQLVVKDG